jgi:hypothetical protein
MAKLKLGAIDDEKPVKVGASGWVARRLRANGLDPALEKRRQAQPQSGAGWL